MFKRVFVAVLIGLSLLTATRPRSIIAAVITLQGAWPVSNPPSGLAERSAVSAKHYSMMAASTGRPDITDLSNATADDLRALYGPMVGNAGVYEIAGNQVTIRPVVAKIPIVMKPGAYEVYEFKVENNNLTLTQRRNVRGPVERGAVWTLTRVE